MFFTDDSNPTIVLTVIVFNLIKSIVTSAMQHGYEACPGVPADIAPRAADVSDSYTPGPTR